MLLMTILACVEDEAPEKATLAAPVPVSLVLDGGGFASGTERLGATPIVASDESCVDAVEIHQAETWIFDLHDPAFTTAEAGARSTLAPTESIGWTDTSGIPWTSRGTLVVEAWEDGTATLTMTSGTVCSDGAGCLEQGGQLVLGPGLVTGLTEKEDGFASDWIDASSGATLCEGDFTPVGEAEGK